MRSAAHKCEARVVTRIATLDAEQWDRCAGDEDPFVQHAFLCALEESGSATAEEGWLPQHLVIEDDGVLLGAVPLYLKGHSYGEYVFDFGWANAFERVGLDYYPKLQCCVPFTPVAGPRLLVAPQAGRRRTERALVTAMVQLAREHQVSSLHVTFASEAHWRLCGELGLQQRIGVQYHWPNRGYSSFDDFLAGLLARKRRAIKKERRRAARSGASFSTLVGDDIKASHWDAFFRFYRNTTDRKWGSAYLTRDFFHMLGATMGDRATLMTAAADGELVAAALNLSGARALYGRYWGRGRHHDALHFELCYYRAIEHAIDARLERVEAGAQGTHKIQRGYLPVRTYSAHWLAHPDLGDAVARFLEQERVAVGREIAILGESSPYAGDRPGERRRPAAE